jgi:ABC-type multidrug transport system fused ATPase/permease subunit
MPLTGITFGLINKWRAKKMSLTDMRVKFTNEVLAGIRVIKYYAWEEPIINKIVEIRVSELNFLRKMGYMFSAVFAILMLGAPQIQVVCIFVVYILLGNDLDVATAFTTMTLFNIMTMPFVFLPFGLQQYSQCRVAMIRICQFLESGELEGYVLNTSEKDVDIHFAGANLCWTPAEDNGDGEPESDIEDKSETIDVSTKAAYTTLSRTEEANEDQFEVLDGGGSNGASESSLHATPLVNTRSVNKTANTLVNLNVKISQGQLVGIVGGVGSGKSSFLSALLGEMHLQSGSVSVRNDASIAFCDQRPFVVNATLKDNILFHKEFDEKRFDAVVDVVCMADDVKILTHGVMTEIGERGKFENDFYLLHHQTLKPHEY